MTQRDKGMARRHQINRARKGADLERRVKHHFERQGCTVIRAAASAGLWDLVVFSPTTTAVVQVKSNRGPRADEWRKLRKWNATPRVVRFVVVWADRVREPVVYAWTETEKAAPFEIVSVGLPRVCR